LEFSPSAEEFYDIGINLFCLSRVSNQTLSSLVYSKSGGSSTTNASLDVFNDIPLNATIFAPLMAITGFP
jgi:hypothetical protein